MKKYFFKKKTTLTKVHGISTKIASALFEKSLFPSAEKELNYLQKNNIKPYFFQEETYPEKLKHCIDAPILLFTKGTMNLSAKRMISIVGTRKVTSYGKDFCKQLIKELAVYNPIIISGFAYGVDICAHKQALQNNLQTIAVVAHGFEKMYPKAHSKYIKQITSNGGFLTDFWHNDVLLPVNFIKRNRIIAGISEATLVIESAKKGGSLVTADIANSYSRDVFAVPGRTTDPLSIGCNELIKRNQAAILTNAKDLALALNWNEDLKVNNPIQKQLFINLNTEEKYIYDYLIKNGKQGLDTIALACKFATSKTATILFQLEMKGCAKPLPGKLFEAV